MPGILSQGRKHYDLANKISPNDSVSQLGYYTSGCMTSSSEFSSNHSKHPKRLQRYDRRKLRTSISNKDHTLKSLRTNGNHMGSDHSTIDEFYYLKGDTKTKHHHLGFESQPIDTNLYTKSNKGTKSSDIHGIKFVDDQHNWGTHSEKSHGTVSVRLRNHKLNQSRSRRRVYNGIEDGYFYNPYAFSELFSQSEIPGFREIFASDSYLRKFCWIIAFSYMTYLAVYDMLELFAEYQNHPITVGLRLVDEPRIPFPSVTVCNLNIVRSSALCGSNSPYNLTNYIPSDVRDRLCGIQIDTKLKPSDSDISDINNIGLASSPAPAPTTVTSPTNNNPYTSTFNETTTSSNSDLGRNNTLSDKHANNGSSLSTTTITTILPVRPTARPGGALDLGDFTPMSKTVTGSIIKGRYSSSRLEINLKRPLVPNPASLNRQPSIQSSQSMTNSNQIIPSQSSRIGSNIDKHGSRNPPSTMATRPPMTSSTGNPNLGILVTGSPTPVNIGPYMSDDFEHNERMERELQENLTNSLAVVNNRNPEITTWLGHQFDDMILRCTMKFNNCTNQRNFKNTFSPTEGNCFTYKSRMRRLTSSSKGSNAVYDEVNLVGTNQGLELVLNLEKTEYITGSSQVGALIMIHHPNETDYAASEATFIAPGFTTYIGLKMVSIARLPDPYPEKCVNDWPIQFADRITRNKSYSQQTCLKICLQMTIQKHCQCQSATLPILELDGEPTSQQQQQQQVGQNVSNKQAPNLSSSNRVFICDTRKLTTRQCVTEVTLRAAERVQNCNCPSKCVVVRYDKTVSMARWPTNEDKVTFDRTKMEVNFQNLAKVIVYFQTMTCDEINQQPVYNSFAKLVSQLGGIIGVYVGFSFLSVFEILEVMSRKSWHHARTKYRNRQLQI